MRWAEFEVISGRRRLSSLHSDDSGRHEKVYSDVLLILHLTDKVIVGHTKVHEVLFGVVMSSYGTLFITKRLSVRISDVMQFVIFMACMLYIIIGVHCRYKRMRIFVVVFSGRMTGKC